MLECSYCKKSFVRLCKGLCSVCYARKMRNGTPEYVQANKRFGVKECNFCGSETGPFVKRLCKACYYREKKNGDLEYRKVVKFCEVPGCGEISKSHGLCGMHLQRVRKHGDINAGRPEGWGVKSTHPMYDSWQWIKKTNPGNMDPRWDDFWVFVSDVGERPSDRHTLRKIELKGPASKDNMAWKAGNLDTPIGVLASRNDYQKTWRTKNREREKHYDLQKLYGATIEQFNGMAEKQNHLCAICEKPEGAIDRGKPRKLALDHCHATGKIRSLLCTNCNTGLGRFQDDSELLHKAIAYLKQHESPPE